MIKGYSPDVCHETHGMTGDRYLICGQKAVMIVQHRNRGEGPYPMCEEHGSHNVSNRNAVIVRRLDHEQG